ncbi:hypothetical protein FOCC_FOCC011003 [Frankliniella occidentalis]|nr:hypothetical protein FOCC_FOCC011003 [Frankliniella occidentalis]
MRRFIYYIEPGTEGSSQTISKGKLPVRYRNVLKRERELAGVSSRAGRHPKTQNNNNPYANVTGVVLTQEIKDAYLWLETNSIFDDWPLLKLKWRLSAPKRLQELYHDEGEAIANYVTKWPVLKHPSGFSLLELDFNCIYPDKELSLLTNWGLFVETIIQLGQDVTDPVAKDCYALAQTVTNPGSKGVLALNILPALCPPTTKVKGVAKRRLLVSNSRAGLLLHVTGTAAIAEQLKERREILYAENKKSQPFLVVVGPNLASIKEFYVDVSGILYRINSLAKAVDVCFKAIIALHADYPPESQKPWMMIQRVLYNITADWDSEVPHELISSYNALCQN